MSVGRAALIGGKKCHPAGNRLVEGTSVICNEYFRSWTLSNHEVFYDVILRSGPSLLPFILIYGGLINKAT